MADAIIEIETRGNADRYARSLLEATKATLTLERAQWALDKAGAALSAVWERVIVQQIEARRQIDQLAKSSQLTGRTIAGLRLAAMEAGQSVDDIVPIDLADRLVDLRDGTQSVVDDFEKLNLTAADFQGLSLDQSFSLITERLATTASSFDRAAVATRLFGGTGEKLISVIDGGARELERYAKAGEGVGAGSEDAAAAVREFGSAMAALELAADDAGSMITQALGESGAATGIKNFALGSIAVVGALAQAIRELGDTFRLWWERDLSLFDPRRFGGIFERIFASGYKEAEEFSKALQAGAKETEGFLEPTRTEVDATTKALSTGERAAFDFGAALQELSGISMDALSSQLTAEQQIGETYDARLESIAAVIAAAKEQGATAEEVAELELRALGAVTAAESERDQALLEAARDRSDAEQDAIGRLRKARQDAHEEAARFAKQESDAAKKRKDDTEQAARDLTSVTASAASGLADLLEDSGKRYRGAALLAFRAAQATAIAQAVVNASLAASQGLAAAPPPLSFALAAANYGAGAIQVATIAAAPPPSFRHVGTRAGELAPDEMNARLTKREIVLTPQGAANANAGIRSRDGGQVVIPLVLDHQVLGQAVARTVRRPDSAMWRELEQEAVGHSRRRT